MVGSPQTLAGRTLVHQHLRIDGHQIVEIVQLPGERQPGAPRGEQHLDAAPDEVLFPIIRERPQVALDVQVGQRQRRRVAEISGTCRRVALDEFPVLVTQLAHDRHPHALSAEEPQPAVDGETDRILLRTVTNREPVGGQPAQQRLADRGAAQQHRHLVTQVPRRLGGENGVDIGHHIADPVVAQRFDTGTRAVRRHPDTVHIQVHRNLAGPVRQPHPQLLTTVLVDRDRDGEQRVRRGTGTDSQEPVEYLCGQRHRLGPRLHRQSRHHRPQSLRHLLPHSRTPHARRDANAPEHPRPHHVRVRNTDRVIGCHRGLDTVVVRRHRIAEVLVPADIRCQRCGDPLTGTRPWKPIAALGEHAGRRTTVRGSLARRLRL
ncbi:hypothetical protein, partial [Nocardia sp. NPDC004604]|uniref:hypothetical protein n=1 Tax=Nocardia sp. NPDC004604 TaxID=3157013 RepID=UPI0033ACAD94